MAGRSFPTHAHPRGPPLGYRSAAVLAQCQTSGDKFGYFGSLLNHAGKSDVESLRAGGVPATRTLWISTTWRRHSSRSLSTAIATGIFPAARPTGTGRADIPVCGRQRHYSFLLVNGEPLVLRFWPYKPCETYRRKNKSASIDVQAEMAQINMAFSRQAQPVPTGHAALKRCGSLRRLNEAACSGGRWRVRCMGDLFAGWTFRASRPAAHASDQGFRPNVARFHAVRAKTLVIEPQLW